MINDLWSSRQNQPDAITYYFDRPSMRTVEIKKKNSMLLEKNTFLKIPVLITWGYTNTCTVTILYGFEIKLILINENK